jgi:hypothetical protein
MRQLRRRRRRTDIREAATHVACKSLQGGSDAFLTTLGTVLITREVENDAWEEATFEEA